MALEMRDGSQGSYFGGRGGECGVKDGESLPAKPKGAVALCIGAREGERVVLTSAVCADGASRRLQCVGCNAWRYAFSVSVPRADGGPGFSRVLRMEGGRPYIATWLVVVASPIRRGSLSRRRSLLRFPGAGWVALERVRCSCPVGGWRWRWGSKCEGTTSVM